MEEEFLSLLAKVMNNQVKMPDEINDLYRIIDEELYECLEDVEFPSVPELSDRLELLLKQIRTLSLYPELAHKEVVAISGEHPNRLLSEIKGIIKGKGFSFVRKYDAQIPILVIGTSNSSVEIVNKLYSKIELTKKELELLLSYSISSNISLCNIVEYIVIKTPVKKEDVCFILDNKEKRLSSIYNELIITNACKINSANIDYKTLGSTGPIDYILCNKSISKKICVNNRFSEENGVTILNNIDFESIFSNKRAIISFFDIFKYATVPLIDYYNRNVNGLTELINDIKDDLIRNSGIGDNGDNNNDEDEIVGFRDELQKKLDDNIKARERINEILRMLEHKIKLVDGTYSSSKSKSKLIMTPFLKDCIFKYYFLIAGIDNQEEKECIKRLLDYGYEFPELIMAYSKYVNGKIIKYPVDDISNINTWENAKMVLNLIDVEEPNDDIASLFRLLKEDDITTGKEWYYWSIINQDGEGLKKAIQMGSSIAMKKMYEEKSKDYKTINYLASILYPEACFRKRLIDSSSGNNVVRIDDEKLVFLKMAAATGDVRAVNEIINILYENVIWNYFTQYGKPLPKDSNNIETYYIVMGLCDYLMSIGFNVAENKERKGVICFCLNQNMSEVHGAFYHSKNNAALFVKGYLAEYGLYNKKDLDKALRCYERVATSEIPAVSNAKKRVKSKIKTREKEIKDEYDEDEDYSGSSTSTTVSSSWCFITTAASCALKKGSDCDELNFLRRFRDEHISVSDEGKALVAEYYNIAPKLIEKIDQEEDASTIYANLWTDYIVPSVKEIQCGNLQAAQDIYVAMVVDLSRKYNVQINTDGYQKLYFDTLERIGYIQ